MTEMLKKILRKARQGLLCPLKSILLMLYVLLLSQGVHNSHINITIRNQTSSQLSLTSPGQAGPGPGSDVALALCWQLDGSE